jgi:glycosyltransferase involved in cell wall biosynthesis
MNEKIVFLIPCKNEALSLPDVVSDIRREFPEAVIVVGDNASEDKTSEVALELGCIVVYEDQPGKGNVIRRLFNSIEADFYFIVDGDSTYDISASRQMYQVIKNRNLDMVIGTRDNQDFKHFERYGHILGNKLINGIYNLLFASKFTDVLSGFRVVSRNFEIEVEMNSHSILLSNSVFELKTKYIPRMNGSVSKLRTYKDGFRILRTIVNLSVYTKPMRYFALIFSPIYTASFLLFCRAFIPYLKSGVVPNLPSLIVSVTLLIICLIGISTSLVLQTLTRNQISSLSVNIRE